MMKIKVFTSVVLLTVATVQAQTAARKNPLLSKLNEPIQFSEVSVADITDATKQSIADAEASLARIYGITAGKHTFANTMLAIDDLGDQLSSVAYAINILSNASTDTAVQNEAKLSMEKLQKFFNEMELNEKLYLVVKNYSQSKEAAKLTGARKLYLKDQIESYNRNGFALSEDKRKELQKINDEISSLEIAFRTNIAAYKDQLVVSAADMKGLPDDYIKARKKEGENYVITLDGPSYTTFMRYAESESARKALLIKYLNRASDKNLGVLQKLLAERQKKASLLGYPSYAAYVADDRMVKTTATVWDFENALVTQVKEKTQADIKELLDVKSRYKNATAEAINYWEASFYNNKLLVDKYQVDQEKVKEYFALENVLDGLFQITQKLFGVKYTEVANPSVWHEDVRMFEVKQGSTTIGRFYLDLHPRENKYTHAACFGIRKGKLYGNTYQIPTAALICNFNDATEGKPALLTHQQAETFFHEFGHVLHSLLTTAELAGQSGTSVKRDFVEAPSQIFENWVWNYDALKLFAKHYKTGEVMPESLFRKMESARNVGSGISASAQLYYGILDYTLHDKFDPAGAVSITQVVKELQNKILPYRYVDGTNFHASFGHLTGYGASYYSYLWSKVYAEDMFSIFEKNGIMDQKTGLRYRDIILSKGGSADEYQMVKDFLGRDPNQDAFLKSLGL